MKPVQVFLILLALAAFGGMAYYANQAIKKPPEKKAQLTITPKKKVEGWLELQDFKDLFDPSHAKFSEALRKIEDNWRPAYANMVFEAIRMHEDAARADEMVAVLKKKTRQKIDGIEFFEWWSYLVKNLADPPPFYPEYKAFANGYKFKELGEYFEDNPTSLIRLDEIVWGGVNRDGIPPLRDPKMLAADEALFMDDTNVVFGIEINGDARAYPKRILAWHEMFSDTVGGEWVHGVYCTLCGSMILYSTTIDDKKYTLGTSGFLYRSNKLMYDEATKSLWSTMKGEPVLGELVNKGIKLEPLQVVTTTWGEWRRQHPDTTVVSLETGFTRNYDEGEAYKDYFASSGLMFSVTPDVDDRLKLKDEILAIRFDELTDEKLAISADFLAKNRIYYDEHGGKKFVVLTDDAGGNRIFECKDVKFTEFQGDKVIDDGGVAWTIGEDGLTNENGDKLERLPAHRAFWFGWFAAFPDTKLVK